MPYISNEPRFKQAGLLKGSEKLGVASSDIDVFVDLGGRAAVYVELKTYGTPLKAAQRTMFQNLIKNSTTPTFLVVASHVSDTDDEICPIAFVEEVYWRYPDEGTSIQWYMFDTSPDDDFNVPKYDGDLIPLNQFLSMLAHTFCPRLLKEEHELPATEDLGPLWEILGWRMIHSDGDWIAQENRVAARLGGINQYQNVADGMLDWTDDEYEAYMATIKGEDGQFWWEKYLNAPEGQK